MTAFSISIKSYDLGYIDVGDGFGDQIFSDNFKMLMTIWPFWSPTFPIFNISAGWNYPIHATNIQQLSPTFKHRQQHRDVGNITEASDLLWRIYRSMFDNWKSEFQEFKFEENWKRTIVWMTPDVSTSEVKLHLFEFELISANRVCSLK